MDNISYEELEKSMPSFFQNYTKIELSFGMMPKIGLNGFLDLRYVKEDIIHACFKLMPKKRNVLLNELLLKNPLVK